MTVIFVWGVTPLNSYGQKILQKSIIEEVSAIPELGLSAEEVDVIFPITHVLEGETKKIVVIVEGLFEIRKNIRRELANRLVSRLTKDYRRQTKVIIKRFAPEQEVCACGKI